MFSGGNYFAYLHKAAMHMNRTLPPAWILHKKTTTNSKRYVWLAAAASWNNTDVQLQIHMIYLNMIKKFYEWPLL